MSLINDALKRARQSQTAKPPERPPLTPLQPVESPAKPQRFGAVAWATLAVVAVTAAAWFLLPRQASPHPNSQTVSTASQPPTSTASSPTAATQLLPALPTEPSNRGPGSSGTAGPSRSSSASTIKISTNIVTRPAASPRSAVPESPHAPNLAANSSIAATTPSLTPSPSLGSQPLAASESTPGQAQPAPVLTAQSEVPPQATTGALPKTIPPTATSPPRYPAELAEFPPFRLQGIVFRLKKPTAIIDGQTVKVGDTIANVRIAKIERMSVTLEKQGQEKILYLGQSDTQR